MARRSKARARWFLGPLVVERPPAALVGIARRIGAPINCPRPTPSANAHPPVLENPSVELRAVILPGLGAPPESFRGDSAQPQASPSRSAARLRSSAHGRQPLSARTTKVGLRRAELAATRTVRVRLGMTPVNDQITNVRNPGKGIGEDEDRIPLVEKRIRQQEQGTGQAQPPKGRRHNHPLELLGRIPLHEEPGEEHGIAHPTDDLPRTPLDPQKLAVVPDQVCEPIHSRYSVFSVQCSVCRMSYFAFTRQQSPNTKHCMVKTGH